MIKNINFLLLCFFCIASITPIVNANLHIFVLPAVYLSWFLSAFFCGKFVKSHITVLALIGLSICWLYKIFGISSAEIGNYFYISVFYTMPICMVFIQKNYTIKQKQILSWLIIIVFFISILSNIFLFNNISTYTQWSFTAAQKDEELVKTLNLGDTSFTVASMVYIGVLTILTLMKRGWERVVFLMGLITSIYYNLVCAGRASVVILLVTMVSCLILVYMNRGFYLNRALAIFISSLAVLLLFGGPMFHFFGDVIENERLSVRMHDLGVLFEGGNTSDAETLGRGELSFLSINTWLRNPISFFFGIGDHRYEAGSVEQVYKIGIGGHSSFFDTLARYGLIGFSLWIGLFVNIFKYLRKLPHNKMLGDLLYVACIVAFARSFMGGVFHAPFAVMTFVLLPCSITLLNKEK